MSTLVVELLIKYRVVTEEHVKKQAAFVFDQNETKGTRETKIFAHKKYCVVLIPCLYLFSIFRQITAAAVLNTSPNGRNP